MKSKRLMNIGASSVARCRGTSRAAPEPAAPSRRRHGTSRLPMPWQSDVAERQARGWSALALL